MSLRLVDADPDSGFNYPYFLYTPEPSTLGDPTPVLVEPPNMPGPTDDFDAHLSEARRRASGGFGRRIADEIAVPFLHPVFPRPSSDPVDWTHYTHLLDRETMRIEDAPLARIDLQLLRMVADAREHLSDRGIAVRSRFLMNGFSASGSFVNRFTALHPETLIAVSAGGFNGMAILPIEEAEVSAGWTDNRPLKYPVGVADLEELTGEPFDLDAFRAVHQFLYLGGDDTNDTLLYPDAWTGPDIRATAVLVYGEDIHEDRFPYCEAVYDQVAAAAVFKTYGQVGHEPDPALADIVAFHERSLAGDEIDEIRTDLCSGDST